MMNMEELFYGYNEPTRIVDRGADHAAPRRSEPSKRQQVLSVPFFVPLCCDKCERKVKNQLLDCNDLQSVTCNQWEQKVTVASDIAPEIILKRLQNIKARSAFWPSHQQA